MQPPHLAGKVGKTALMCRADSLNGRIVEVIAQRSGRLHENAGIVACNVPGGRFDAAAAGRAGPVVPKATAAVGRTHIAHRRHRHRRRHIQLCPMGKAVAGRQSLRIVHMQSLLTKQSSAA